MEARKSLKTHTFFVYAQLKDPKQRDTVTAPGKLRKREDGDGVARFGEDYGDVVRGQLRQEPDLDAIKRLDRTEGRTFKRKLIKLTDGRWVWAYEYVEKDWESLPEIPGGRWTTALLK